jgi:predicted Ser/Thr protein kinase
MEKPIGFELLEVGNEYEFIMKNRPNSLKGKVIDIGEDTITYEFKTGAFFNDNVIEGKSKKTLKIENIQEIKRR